MSNMEAKKVSRDTIRVILPSAVIGAGMASGAMISVPVGVVVAGVGVAIAAFSFASDIFPK